MWPIISFLLLSTGIYICSYSSYTCYHTLRASIKRTIKMLLHCTVHSGQKYPKCLINILRYKLPKNFFTSWKSSKSIFELKKWKNITLEKWTFFYILAHCAESVLLHRLSRNTGSYLGVTRRLISICVLISVMIVILRYTPLSSNLILLQK